MGTHGNSPSTRTLAQVQFPFPTRAHLDAHRHRLHNGEWDTKTSDQTNLKYLIGDLAFNPAVFDVHSRDNLTLEISSRMQEITIFEGDEGGLLRAQVESLVGSNGAISYTHSDSGES